MEMCHLMVEKAPFGVCNRLLHFGSIRLRNGFVGRVSVVGLGSFFVCPVRVILR